MDLPSIVGHIADAIAALDACGVPFKAFAKGAGPYGEPQLVRSIADSLNRRPEYGNRAKVKRSPDLLLEGLWAFEVKLARPFGDNGREAENWSVNLLHPYPGNVSSIGDALKLQSHAGPERRAVIAVGYEHSPPQISLDSLFRGFELIATNVVGVRIGPRVQERRLGLVHSVHQQVIVVAWEVLPGRQDADPSGSPGAVTCPPTADDLPSTRLQAKVS